MISIWERMPGAELISKDEVETQYQVTFEQGLFWLTLPTGKNPENARLIFVFSGHSGVGKDNNLTRSDIAAQFRRKMLCAGFGFVCAVCSPDAFGDPESTEATIAASQYCRSCGLNVPEKIPLLGFSMGGLGVLMFAARYPEKVSRIVDVFGITDLEQFFRAGYFTDFLGRLTQEERTARAPMRRPEIYRDIPILILHGDQDNIVDISHSQQFYEALKQQRCPVQFRIIPGYGHTNDILADAGVFVEDFFKE